MKYSSKLTDPALGTYRFRIGDYRVIFDIEDEEIVFCELIIEKIFTESFEGIAKVI